MQSQTGAFDGSNSVSVRNFFHGTAYLHEFISVIAVRPDSALQQAATGGEVIEAQTSGRGDDIVSLSRERRSVGAFNEACLQHLNQASRSRST